MKHKNINTSNDLLCGEFTSRKGCTPRKFYKQKDATPEIVYMIIKKRLGRIKDFDTSTLMQYKNYKVLQKLTTDELNNIRKRILFLYNKQQLEDYKTNVINEMLKKQKDILEGKDIATQISVPDLIY